jgi:plasmid stability protein
MVDILVRNLDDDIARRLKEKAKAKGASVNETAREAIAAYVKPSPTRAEAIEKITALRESIGPVSGDSTPVIRRMRDRGWSGD